MRVRHIAPILVALFSQVAVAAVAVHVMERHHEVVVERLVPGSASAATALQDIRAALVKVEPATVIIDTVGTNNTTDEGTGMLVSTDGLVVTNHHVIAGADTIVITLFGSKQRLKATVVRDAPEADITLLRTTAPVRTPTITFADSGALIVGDPVAAIGNLEGKGELVVSSGIVSEVNAEISVPSPGGAWPPNVYSGVIVTDTALGPGDSGGPLIISDGRVMGMNTLTSETAGDSSRYDLGFAIPANTIRSFLTTAGCCS